VHDGWARSQCGCARSHKRIFRHASDSRVLLHGCSCNGVRLARAPMTLARSARLAKAATVLPTRRTSAARASVPYLPKHARCNEGRNEHPERVQRRRNQQQLIQPLRKRRTRTRRRRQRQQKRRGARRLPRWPWQRGRRLRRRELEGEGGGWPRGAGTPPAA